ncbi:MAG TPA: hypothetical protein VM597_04690 [Gemmataceae bacterium]|jgi:hypothetical protein|nr:hypothetical protein [Gemmataceae bacterium]
MSSTLILVLLAGTVAQPAGGPPPFVREYARKATFYYKAPDPELGPKMLKSILQKENLEFPPFNASEGHVLNLIAAQIGDIGAGHPKVVRAYEAEFADAPPAGRKVILRALENAGDKETVKQVEAWLADPKYADAKAGLEALKKHLEDPKRTHARDREPKTPKDLDLLWSNFFITGEYAPVSRILDVFDRADADATMKGAARWSLGSNLQQHPKLVELVMKNAKDRPEGSKKVIDEVILVPKN